MFQSIARWFEKRDWRLVKRIDHPYKMYNRQTKVDIKTNCALSYYLYENQFRKRKIDVIDSEEGDLNLRRLEALGSQHYLYRNETYRETIRPWLDGRLDPEIPTYEQVPKDDFQNALAGKKVK